MSQPTPPEPSTPRDGASAEALYRLEPDPPELVDPVLVMAPEGWIDAGGGGSLALGAMTDAMAARVVATFHTDLLVDHRSRRPGAEVSDGVYGELKWPTIEMVAGTDANGSDVLVLTGPEPDYRWRAYSGAVADLCRRFGVRMLVSLGAFPAPVPHTRVASLAATSTDAELAQRVGVVEGTLEVPAGVAIAIQQRCHEAGIPALALWARVPYYAAAMACPEAAVRLLEGLGQVSGLRFEIEELMEAARANTRRLDDLVSNSAEHQNLLRRLEAQFDAEAGGGDGPGAGFGTLPTGDELAAELERYLRDQEG